MRIDNLWHKNAYGIWVFDRAENGDTRVAQPVPLEFGDKTHNVAFVLPEPTFELRPDAAQSFFQAMLDEMARHGLRANNDKVAGQLEMQTKHLEDMRKLVFK